MGGRVARRLLQAGYELVVWNRSPGKLTPLIEAGASAAATPREAAARASTLITMVADGAALRAVSEGSAGIAAGAGKQLTVIDMSTVGPAAVARLAATLPGGTGLVDAPVMGSTAEAEAGTLSIFAGGPPGVVDAARPVLSLLGTVAHVGPLGSGAGAKLVANAVLFGALTVLGEALALARGFALSPDAVSAVLAATPLADQANRRRPMIAAGEYPPRFRLALARKDAELIIDAANTAGVRAPATQAARAWLADAEAAGLGSRDYTAMLAAILNCGGGPAQRGEAANDR
jgi:3-hydroxyisobutyrate dehydrogenase